jgi:hypothetical protein
MRIAIGGRGLELPLSGRPAENAMASAPPQVPLDRPLFMQPWLGYWRTKTKLERLRRFQDLIRHRERWAGGIDLAQPIEKLLPGVPEQMRSMRIPEEINKLMRLVFWDLNFFARVPTGVYYKDRNVVDNQEERRRYDLILDYFPLPREAGREHMAFESVMDVLNEGIGVLEARMKQARRELFNPLIWMAYLIRMPVTVMEWAGFGTHEKTQDLLIGAYARFMKIMMGVILILVTLLLGVKVPWKEIAIAVFNWIFK